jgi:hypothetical protein
MQKKELLGTLSLYLHNYFSATKRKSKQATLDYWLKIEARFSF